MSPTIWQIHPPHNAAFYTRRTPVRRIAFFLYGLSAHLLFLGVYAYLIGFLTNLVVPVTVDRPPARLAWPAAAAVDLLLLLTFGVQHSVMARPGFKRWWSKFVPVPVERSTYVMISNALVILMFVLWKPLPAVVWHVEARAWRCTLWAVGFAGWLLVPAASLVINHFDLFGTRQVWLHLKGQPYTDPPFRTPLLYRLVRHPLYVGWLLAFWFTPTMTAGHLLFAGVLSAYILIAIQFEERDLRKAHGEEYEAWRRKTGMLIPRPATFGGRRNAIGAAMMSVPTCSEPVLREPA
jgi:protein-S-isoprenylcysteine O-methyltransferase Ste14